MNRILLVISVLYLNVAGVAAAPDAPAERKQADVKEHVLKLIDELGSDEYAQRRRAEEELIRLGPDAFDQLKVAEENPDLEIAERAAYILQRMRVEWVRAEDPADVRRILARYGDLPENEKLYRITRLARLKDGEGFPALCRITRLEPAPQIARRASLAIVNRGRADEKPAPDAKACQQELGTSNRPPVEWIQIYLRELVQPRETLAEWNAAIDAEMALLNQKSPDTEYRTVDDLLQRRLELCHELKLLDETTEALVAMVELSADGDEPRQSTAKLAWALKWIIDRKQWDVLDQISQRYHERIYAERLLLYCLAAATSRAGRTDEATKLSDTAFEMKSEDSAQRVVIAEAVANLGQVEWAEREYRAAIEELPPVDPVAIMAHKQLAAWLHDREDHEAAANLLGEVFEALDKDGAARAQLMQNRQSGDYLRELASSRDYYQACHHEAQGQYDRQRECLNDALNKDRNNPDILIAMYRLKDADDEFRQQTRERIKRMTSEQLKMIDQFPENPSEYNLLAWLIGNTEGDYAKAVELSLRSLELSSEEPSYLDTLGRCYYAAGDLENAVKAQRRAVELAPHYGVMRRQLALFERELAAKGKN